MHEDDSAALTALIRRYDFEGALDQLDDEEEPSVGLEPLLSAARHARNFDAPAALAALDGVPISGALADWMQHLRRLSERAADAVLSEYIEQLEIERFREDWERFLALLYGFRGAVYSWADVAATHPGRTAAVPPDMRRVDVGELADRVARRLPAARGLVEAFRRGPAGRLCHLRNESPLAHGLTGVDRSDLERAAGVPVEEVVRDLRSELRQALPAARFGGYATVVSAALAVLATGG